MRSPLIFFLAAAAAALAPLTVRRSPAAQEQTLRLPAEFQRLRELPLSDREKSFAAGFPGSIHRLTDGEREWIVRAIRRPSRLVHPAEHCFRSMNYRVTRAPLRCGSDGCWSSFDATRGPEHLRVYQRVIDPSGRSWRDVSSWYWSAWFGRSQGPWFAVTEAVTLPSGIR
ncbi:MAG: hypothetical protein ACKV22_11905 [Bryobacteraceae bacterium]